MCLFWISLTMVTLSSGCYSGTLSLWQPFFAKGLSFFARVLSFCMTMPGVIHPTGLTAIYGCTFDRLWISPNLVLRVFSVTEFLKSTWLASDCSRCWCEASYHLLATDTRCVFTLEYKPWYHCDYVEVWSVPSAAHVPCIDQSHSNILTWECLLLYFLKGLCLYIAVWAGEFKNTWCSEWWSLCHLLTIFLQ